MSVNSFLSELTCKPLQNIEEVYGFLNNPPAWRSLCTELKQHSNQALKNEEIIENFDEKSNKNFCHFEPNSDFDIKRHEEKNMSKILVCHDMANGYHDDSYINGTKNYEAYNFYNWNGIDIFCYFSHHFITIPPLAWINVGHAHGVKVIGTLITEHGAGAAIWNSILVSEKEWKHFASALVAIAKCMRFDGWLLNVENKITQPQELLLFVEYLREVLHAEVPGSLLIWYDSVTVNGYLAWQNGLNEHNKAFFDVSDGIFTNYSWKEDHISSSVIAAGDRRHDVFVGVDVWGRNFIGGGKFNTAHAVKIAYKYDCSLAIFAPAWTHEAIPSSCPPSQALDRIPADSLNRFDNFLLRDRAFWATLWPYLKTRLPTELPFKTSFCRGQGVKKWLYGEIISEDPWYNMRQMEYQPNSAHSAHGYELVPEVSGSNFSLFCKPTEKECLELYLADGFIGGSCLKLNPSDQTTKQHRTIRLFHCDFKSNNLIICVVTKKMASNRRQYLNLIINIDNNGIKDKYVLFGSDSNGSDDERDVFPVRGEQYKELQRYLLSEAPDYYVPNNPFGWDVNYYAMRTPNSRVLSIDCRTGMSEGAILLGHIALCHGLTIDPDEELSTN